MTFNYYIQGDAANADRIKAAFEKLNTHSISGYDFSRGDVLFFSFTGEKGVKYMMSTNMDSWLADLITTHPGYKELELPVKPEFKVGIWIVGNEGIFKITQYEDEHGYNLTDISGGVAHFVSPDYVESNFHLWSIADAKDGDVLVTTKIRNCPFIYRKTDCNDNLAHYYAGVDGDGDFCEGCLKRTSFHFGSVADVVPATKEQRDLLFKKMKEAGYQWDADKKELRKIKQHYDISNFKPFDKVLVRYADADTWRCTFFSHYVRGPYAFFCTDCTACQCIPYNDDTKHLLGTTDMCDEQYINW